LKNKTNLWLKDNKTKNWAEIKGIVRVISSDLSCKYANACFTTVSLKALSDQG